MKFVIPPSLKRDLAVMLEEHKAIVAALETMIAAATSAGQPEYAWFAGKLILHAQTEEEVAYPAAILIGEYVKLRLGIGKDGFVSVLR
jgi:hypothetical protein